MAISADMSYRPKDTNMTYHPPSTDTQRRRMAIDSVLNPSDSSTSTDSSKYNPSIKYSPSTTYSPRLASSDDRSRQSSSSADSTDYRRFSFSQHARPSSRSHTRTSSHSRPSSRQGHGSASARERREMRPTYQQEEEYFIWYHRVDLGLDWRDVRSAYNAQFPNRQRRGFQGIQCKYYRCCETHGIPRVRERNRGGGVAVVGGGATGGYGVRQKLPGLWYPWMERKPGMGIVGQGDTTKMDRN